MTQKSTENTKKGGWLYGKMPIGCRMCMKGMKMVYFMGAGCVNPPHCSWYCPISKQRKVKSSHYADELEINDSENIEKTIEVLKHEANAIGARGMSITGGDPLSSSREVNWAASVISLMKTEFGKKFHIHLYTCGKTFSVTVAQKLSNAGLDSLRFHPEESDFSKIELALGYSFRVGAEVPVIPAEENHQYLLRLADYLDSIGADYLNLNEFEMVAPNQTELIERGYKLKKDAIAAVEGSDVYAKKFLREFNETHPSSTLSIHYCTASLKDGVQVKNRYKRRARNIKRGLEEITQDGTLLFLRIKGDIKTIQNLYHHLREVSKMPENMIDINPNRGFLDLPPFLAKDHSFRDMLSTFNVKGGLHEILPFREDESPYQQVEYTPLSNYSC